MLITHPLLDATTVYGTQLWLPFTNHPVGVGSLFVIDPLYTLPLLVGVMLALAWRWASGWRCARAAARLRGKSRSECVVCVACGIKRAIRQPPVVPVPHAPVC